MTYKYMPGILRCWYSCADVRIKAVFMGVDMFGRLDAVISRAAGVKAVNGKKGL